MTKLDLRLLTHTSCSSFSFFALVFSDLMKSEERQKLAKERREEKAKYLGKWKQEGWGGHIFITQGESVP